MINNETNEWIKWSTNLEVSYLHNHSSRLYFVSEGSLVLFLHLSQVDPIQCIASLGAQLFLWWNVRQLVRLKRVVDFGLDIVYGIVIRGKGLSYFFQRLWGLKVVVFTFNLGVIIFDFDPCVTVIAFRYIVNFSKFPSDRFWSLEGIRRPLYRLTTWDAFYVRFYQLSSMFSRQYNNLMITCSTQGLWSWITSLLFLRLRLVIIRDLGFICIVELNLWGFQVTLLSLCLCGSRIR